MSSSSSGFESIQSELETVIPSWRFNGITREIEPGMSYDVDESGHVQWLSREETASVLEIPLALAEFQIIPTSVSLLAQSGGLGKNAVRFSSESGFSTFADTEISLKESLPVNVKMGGIFRSSSKNAVKFDLTDAEEFTIRNKLAIFEYIIKQVTTDKWPLNRRLVVSAMKASSLVYAWTNSRNGCYGIGIDANGHLIDITSYLKLNSKAKQAQSGEFPSSVPSGRYTGLYQPAEVRIETDKDRWQIWKPRFIEDSGKNFSHLYSHTNYGKAGCRVRMDLLNPKFTRDVKRAEEEFPKGDDEEEDDDQLVDYAHSKNQ